MNDWRTTFNGVNDHEADWEASTVYLAETSDGPEARVDRRRPRTTTSGDDLRRRWDDPDLRLVGDHPVVFVGAGSHSGAVIAGPVPRHRQPRSGMRPVRARLPAA